MRGHGGARTVVLLLACAALVLLVTSGCGRLRRQPADQADSTGRSERISLNSGGLERTCSVHVPPSYRKGMAVPLVLVFHGGGGTGEGMEKLTHMDEVADDGGFMVVYPDGVDGNWNDGRPEINPGVDDVGFIRDLLGRLEADYSIDAGRVYATGISNGGFMSYRLAFDMADRFAAIAPVGALLTEQLYAGPPPSSPVSVLLIEGTDDPFVPWSGGEISAGLRSRGQVVSTDSTIDYWVTAEACSTPPTVTDLPDSDPADGTRVRSESYGGGRDGTAVELLAIEGGGHTWPGGTQYLPERTIGRTSRDIDASRVIWEFFEAHAKLTGV